MRRSRSSFSFAWLLLSLAVVLPAVTTVVAQSPASRSSSDASRLAQEWGQLPLVFEANRGQTDSVVDYLSRGRGYTAFLTSSGATLSLRQHSSAASDAIRLTLLGAGRNIRASAEQQIPGKVNYLIGSDSAQWEVGIPQYSRVRYTNVYPGIDLVYYGNPGQLEYDFVVQSGADLSKIALQLEGAQSLRIAGNGDLTLLLPDGEIAWKRPEVYQLRDGKRTPVSSEYQIAANTLSFKVGDYDHARPLVIDPSLSFGTYIGTPDSSTAIAITLDSSKNVYIAGLAGSSQYPTTPGAYQTTYGGGSDAFITKLSADGSTLLYSTYVGGSSYEWASSVAVDSSGNAYAGGVTQSSNFPVTPGALHLFNTSVNGYTGFILKLNATGSALIYSAEVGNASVPSIAIDSAGDVYATGTTSGSPFETTSGAYKTTVGTTKCPGFGTGGQSESYVMELNPGGSAPVFSTYISDCEQGAAIAVQNGEAYITGSTQQNHPVTSGVVQPTYGGGFDAFVTKLNTAGSALVYSTYLGGTDIDQGNGIAVDNSGNTIVGGFTFSTNYPVANAFQGTATTSGDAFVTKLNPTGTAFVYSTYLGGSAGAWVSAVAIDSTGNAYVSGNTQSKDFPIQDAFQGICGGSTITGCRGAAFVSKFSTTGSLVSSTYYGPPTNNSGASGLALDSLGNAYIDGAAGPGLPTTPNAYEKTTTNGSYETIFAAKINMGGTTGCTNLRQNRTVALCTPFTSSTYGNMVEVSALVNDTNPVNAIQVYVDGVLELENDTSSGIGGFAIDSYVQVPTGTHRITVKAWDSKGSFESVRSVAVSGTSVATCAVGEILPYVQVCTPSANSASTSPLEVNAVAEGLGDAITRMTLYVDYKSTYTINNSSTLNTTLTLAPGIHRLTVQVWDSGGEIWKQIVYTTVH
jgi:Beta-propeller repeat